MSQNKVGGVEIKLSFSGIFWGFVCIGVGCFFLAGTWGACLEYKRVQAYDGRTTGHITGKHFSRAADGNGIYYIDYWYPIAGGTKISSTNSILKQNWDVLKIDDTLEIRYDKLNPIRSLPLYGGSVSLVYAFFVFVLGAVFLVFGVMRLINSFKIGYNKTS